MKCDVCEKEIGYVNVSMDMLGVDVDYLTDEKFIKCQIVDSINYLRLKQMGVKYFCPECECEIYLKVKEEA